MANAKIITRRVAILGGFAGAGLLVANADKLTLDSDFARAFHAVEDWTKTAQRGLLFPERLARESQPVRHLAHLQAQRHLQSRHAGI